MRIAFVGNQDNNAYRYCKGLREQGVDVDLYMIPFDSTSRSKPELIDRAILDAEGCYPDWIRTYGGSSSRAAWIVSRNPTAAAIEANYDLVVTSGLYGTLAAGHFHRVPLVHLTLGEVTSLPHMVFDRRSKWHWRAASLLSRRVLSKARAVVVAFPPEIQSLIRLGIADKARIWGFPEDVRGNPGRVDQELLAQLKAKYAAFDRVLMWPSRLNFLDKRTEEYKGPENFLFAFERLIHSDHRNVRAVIGTHGYDVEPFRQLVREKGLEPHIDFIPHQTVYQLLTYFSLPNVIVCDTISPERGILAGSAREAVSVGCVLVKSLDVAFTRLCYGRECPIDVVWNGEECHAALSRLIDLDPVEFAERQCAIRDWALNHLDTSKQIPKLMHVLEQVLYTERLKPKAA